MKLTPASKKLRALEARALIDLYRHKRLSQNQISEKFGVSRTCVQTAFKRYKIAARTNAESQTAINSHRGVKFNDAQEQMILGSLLGDGFISRQVIRSNKTGRAMEILRLTFAHTAKHVDYLTHKNDLLGGCVKEKRRRTIGDRLSGHGAHIKYFSFCHTPTLRPFAKLCLDENYKLKVNQKWLDKLSWRGIAYWYQDDGCLGLIKGGRRRITFHTNSQSRDEIHLLQRMLKNRFMLTTNLAAISKTKNEWVLVASRNEEVNEFLKNVEPYVVGVMKYKLRREGIYDASKGRPRSNIIHAARVSATVST